MESWFSEGLIQWYLANKRDLPWRNVKDPYKIWLSEVILQQTQVKQGLNYYTRFTKAFPNVKVLAKAKEDEVLKLWQGLGYYSRARNLHSAAKYIVSGHKGKFPNKYEDIRKLKGVGDYTASAIASFSFDLPHAVVDGNVYRVLSRVFGINTAIDTHEAKKRFQDLANKLLDVNRPALHNQAIMEFGSQFCKPLNPDCLSCIFLTKCFALQHQQVNVLPLKSKLVKIKKRYFNYVVQTDANGMVLIYKRQESDIWKGLYEFLLIESETELLPEAFIKHKTFIKHADKSSKMVLISKVFKHVLSHQHLYARFYVVQSRAGLISQKKNNTNSKAVLIQISEIKHYAFSRLTLKFIESCNLKEIV